MTVADARRTMKTMKTATIEGLKEAGKLLARGESILVVDEKRRPIGTLRPVGWPDEGIPLRDRRRQYLRRTAALKRELAKKGITEEHIERDIAAVLKRRR